MMPRKSYVLIISAMLLTACGGGGGGGIGSPPSVVKTTIALPPSTSITGTVTPPVAPGSGTGYPGTANMLMPPNSVKEGSAIIQSTDYAFDPVAVLATPPMLLVAALTARPVDTHLNSSITIKTDATGQTTDLIAKYSSSTIPFTLSTATGSSVTQTMDISGLPTATIHNAATASVAEFALPYSATLNATGYVYQTFGLWLGVDPVSGVMSENYFSAGVPVYPSIRTGKATYTGQATGSFVDAATRDLAYTSATMNATADFATYSVAFATTGTTSLSANAPANVLPTASPNLDLNGTLTYSASSNTFTGIVNSANGMSGNATGRFYGPRVATTTYVPPEIGGTFAVMGTGIGAMQGAFGGRTGPTPISITGNTAPPAGPASGYAGKTPDMLVGPNYPFGDWNAVVQGASYYFDPVAAVAPTPATKVMTLNLAPLDANGSLRISTGAAYPTDPALGQPDILTTGTSGVAYQHSIASGLTVASQTTDIAGLPTQTLVTSLPSVTRTSRYILPYSVSLNPAGYIYQTFGMWQEAGVSGVGIAEWYFSAGTPTSTGALPVAGTATYSGKAAGTYVDAATRDIGHTSATMNATADFAALSIAFNTTGTTSLAIDAAAGTLPSASLALDMSGTLNYAAGSNTFTGAVTTVNGMSGNATGRFYGSSFDSGGLPPEIGGTFAVMSAGTGAMQGAFGGSLNPAVNVAMPTLITGTVTPPAAPSPSIVTGLPNMLLAPNSSVKLEAVMQGMDYTFSRGITMTNLTVPAASLDIRPVDTRATDPLNPFYYAANLWIGTGAAHPVDPALGQTISISGMNGPFGFATGLSVANGAVLSETVDMGGLTTATLTSSGSWGSTIIEYALPYSATMNPNGYTYQTFGVWQDTNLVTRKVDEVHFSAGTPTAVGTLPLAGTATYAGQAAGTYVDASTRDVARTNATMSATADFATSSIAFMTTGTTSVSKLAPIGTAPTANPGLDMNGTLSYAAGSNTFSGVVTTANGMSGNATGRFYGPGIAAATPTKVVGAPPEIGGTFAVMGTGGAMQGAFGGN